MGGAWAPNGSKIAFLSDRDGNPEIYVVNADGTNVRRLTNTPANDGSPSWSPDGSKLVFSSNRAGTPDIHVMNANGSGVRRLTNDPGFDGSPAWSPDGSKILFVRSAPRHADVYVMNSDGSAVTNLTNTPASSECEADIDDCVYEQWAIWSPDGSKIAFITDRGEFNDDQLSIMNANGSGVRVISEGYILSQPDWQSLRE